MARGSTGKVDVSGNQTTEDNILAMFILLERKFDLKKIREKASDHKNVHMLGYNEGNLIWEKTFGKSIEILQTSVSSQFHQKIPEEEFIKTIGTRDTFDPVVISGSPGMGKSVLLAKLAEETRKRYSRNSLVLYFITLDFITAVQKEQEKKGKMTFKIVCSNSNEQI